MSRVEPDETCESSTFESVSSCEPNATCSNACKVPEDNLTIKYKNQHTYSQGAYPAHNCVSNVLHMLEEAHLPEKYIIALATGIMTI